MIRVLGLGLMISENEPFRALGIHGGYYANPGDIPLDSAWMILRSFHNS